MSAPEQRAKWAAYMREWYRRGGEAQERAKQQRKEYANAHPENTARYKAEWYERNREQAYQSAKAWQQRNPELNRIQRNACEKVRYAIRKGRLVRPAVCEQCGSEGRITAAHESYDRPLDVRWLCWSCHIRWDKERPKLR